MQDVKRIIEELTAYVEKKELVGVLMKYVEQTMIHYDACHPIREKSYQIPKSSKSSFATYLKIMCCDTIEKYMSDVPG